MAFSREAQHWNRHVFGHIGNKKQRCKATLHGVQIRLAEGHSNRLELLEQALVEFADILKHEELLWLQKSRTRWWLNGENNKRYSHNKAISRRRHNTVYRLKNVRVEWVADSNQLKIFAR